jgi:hypothetical protein
MPASVGTATATAMGIRRQRSRSRRKSGSTPAAASAARCSRPGFESVYPGVGMRAGAGGSAGRERSMGLGRQRILSAGEGVHSRLYPHQHPNPHPYPHPPADRQHNYEWHSAHPMHPDAVAAVGVRAGDYQQGKVEETGMGKGTGRLRSSSAGANVITSPHADPHGPAFANIPSCS